MTTLDTALTAPWPEPREADPEAAERRRRRKAFRAAHRHSRRVRLLRVLLPAAGVLVVLAFVVATHFALPLDVDLSVAHLSVTRNGIVMDNPHLTGFDRHDRQYSVSADRAIQALSNPNAVRLTDIRATVGIAGQGTAKVTAEAGDYDHKSGTLKLQGGIALDSSQGYALRMYGAEVDFEAGTLVSDNPATVSYKDSQTTGQSISVSDGGAVIVFDGGVRTTLMPPKRGMEPAHGRAGE
jgi:lipopolysaccharide export system protein LptC